LALNRCQNCLTHEDLLGLVASVGIQKFPKFVPSVVFETDKTVVIRNPHRLQRVHYIIVPKKDIKNIGEISQTDAPYLLDAFFVARSIIEKEGLSHYRLSTNGSGFQDVTYLHFHLVGE
jgi:histidine triad (HIT) family protein